MSLISHQLARERILERRVEAQRAGVARRAHDLARADRRVQRALARVARAQARRAALHR